jgi:hypothetical protein
MREAIPTKILPRTKGSRWNNLTIFVGRNIQIAEQKLASLVTLFERVPKPLATPSVPDSDLAYPPSLSILSERKQQSFVCPGKSFLATPHC